MKRLLFLPLLVFLVSCGGSGSATIDITSEQLPEILNKEHTVILDVRTPEELSDGVIDAKRDFGIRAEFVHVDFHNKEGLNLALERLDKEKPIIAYCAGGTRSAKTCKLLNSKGFKTVYNLEGGFSTYHKKPAE